MNIPRTLLADFALQNLVYAGATISVYQVDTALAATTTLAPLYAGPVGDTLLANPQVLSSTGRNAAPIYIDSPVVVQINQSGTVTRTGILGLAGRWRGPWETGTTYFIGERVRHPTSSSTYIVATSHVAGTFADDVTAGKLVDEIDGNDLADGFLNDIFPVATSRINKYWGFDSQGAPILLSQFDRSADVVTATGATSSRSLALHLRAASPANFGGVGDGVADDANALQASASYAAANGLVWLVPEGTWRTTAAIAVAGGVAGVEMHGTIAYNGAGAEAALTIGTGGTYNNQAKRIMGLSVTRSAQSTWTNEADVGIALQNFDACLVHVKRVEGFTIGVQTIGDGRGFEDTTLILGRIVNNKIGLDARTLQASGWNNSIRYLGGHFACDSAINPTLGRFGVRFSNAGGAYSLHNEHLFIGPAFELQRQGTPGTVDAIPFLVDATNARCIVARGIRMEQCSTYVARHTGGANDCVYEVHYTGTYAFTGNAIDYTSAATRAGGTVYSLHQAAATHGTPRLIANAPNIRAAAFRQTIDAADSIGFDQLAVMSSNPSGPPTTLTGFAFAGLNSIALNAGDVTLPTSRGLAFVVDCSMCKEFFIAAEGTALRPIIQQYDAIENVLGSTSVVLFSNANAIWSGTNATWWEMNVDLDSTVGGLAINRLQRVTLSANAQIAAIGVRGGLATSVLKSLRLYTPAEHSPRIMFGANRKWGNRETTVQDTGWTIPALAANATATRDVTISGVRQGDFVSASFAKTSGFQNGGVIFHASVGGTASIDQVRVTAQNISGGSITVDTGTLFVRAIKPRI